MKRRLAEGRLLTKIMEIYVRPELDIYKEVTDRRRL